MQSNVNINVINTPLGVPASSDGVMGLFCHAIAVGSTFTLDTAYLLTKLDDLVTLGIDANYDINNNLAVYQQVSEFYGQSGDGALLWLVGTSAGTAFATYVASNIFKNLIRGTAQANPANRVKMIGICYQLPIVGQTGTDFPADVDATVSALYATQQSLFQEGYQFSAIVDGYTMSSTITPTNLTSAALLGKYSVSLCITGTKPNGVASVGLALGRFARITIGHGFGAVADGSVNTNAAYLTNGIQSNYFTTSTLIVGNTYIVKAGIITYNSVAYNPGDSVLCVSGHTSFTTSAGGYLQYNVAASDVSKLFPADFNALGSGQFMFLRTRFGNSGFFWNDGSTCISATYPLATQEFNRVANALSADALSFFTTELGKNLPVDKKTGNLDSGYCNNKSAQFYAEYIAPLTSASGSGDITDASLTITGVNFVATRTLKFALNILPTQILGTVNGTVEFTTTL